MKITICWYNGSLLQAGHANYLNIHLILMPKISLSTWWPSTWDLAKFQICSNILLFQTMNHYIFQRQSGIFISLWFSEVIFPRKNKRSVLLLCVYWWWQQLTFGVICTLVDSSSSTKTQLHSKIRERTWTICLVGAGEPLFSPCEN